MSDNIHFKRLGYWSVAVVGITGALAGCEYCIPTLVALAILALLRHAANEFSTHNVQPV